MKSSGDAPGAGTGVTSPDPLVKIPLWVSKRQLPALIMQLESLGISQRKGSCGENQGWLQLSPLSPLQWSKVSEAIGKSGSSQQP